jgi:hypothetical protein
MRVRDLWMRVCAAMVEDDLFEMSNITPKTTGLPYVVWVSKGARMRHGPRVKAYASKGKERRDEIVVTIAEEPQVMRQPRRPRIPAENVHQLVAFVRQNREVLLRYWQDDEMGIEELLVGLRPVR